MTYFRALFCVETAGLSASRFIFAPTLARLLCFSIVLYSFGVYSEFVMNLGQSDCKERGEEEVTERGPDAKSVQGRLTSYHSLYVQFDSRQKYFHHFRKF